MTRGMGGPGLEFPDQVDVESTIWNKLDVEMPSHRIFDECKKVAYQAIDETARRNDAALQPAPRKTPKGNSC